PRRIDIMRARRVAGDPDAPISKLLGAAQRSAGRDDLGLGPVGNVAHLGYVGGASPDGNCPQPKRRGNWALATDMGGKAMATPAKIAVITGAGSGIGRASAHALLEDGWTVVLAGRRKNMLEETATLANAPPPRTLAVPTDVADAASIAALFDAVKQT